MKIHSYFRVSEIEDKLKISAQGELPPLFMVPSSGDRELLLDMLPLGALLSGADVPDIQNWGGLYKAIGSAVAKKHPLGTKILRRQIDPPDHHLILRFLVNCFLEEADLEGLTLPAGVRRNGFIPLLGKNVRELLREDVTPEQLGRSLGCAACELLCPRGGTPEEVLCRLYHRYLEYLEMQGLADSAQIPALTRQLLLHEDAVAWVRDRRFIFVGFLSFTNGQLNLVRQLLETGVSVDFFIPETGLVGFHDALEQLLDVPVPRASSEGRFCSLAGGDLQLQWDTLARELVLWNLGQSDFLEGQAFPGYGGIGIHTPAEYFPYLQSSLRRYRIPFCSRGERTAGETVLGELPRRIWEAGLSGWTTNQTFYLLSHPCLMGESIDRATVFEAMPEGRRAWRGLAPRIPSLERALDLIFDFSDFLQEEEGHTPVALLKALLALVEDGGFIASVSAIADPAPSLDGAVRELASARMELERKIRFLEELQPGLGDAGNVCFARGEAVAFLTDWGKEATSALSPQLLDAVTLYDSPPPVLARFPVWIMTDVDGAHWPGKLRESPLLNNEGRCKINEMKDEDFLPTHLPTLHDERQQREGLFRRLLATGEELVILCHSLQDSQGRPQGQSPFLSALQEAPGWVSMADRAVTLNALLPEGTDPVLMGVEVHAEEKWQSRYPMPPVGIMDSTPSEGQKVYLSTLDNWIDCPFYYWCRSVQRLEELRFSSFDAAKAGTLLHALWERVWVARRETPDASLQGLVLQEWEDLMAAPPEELAEFVHNPQIKRHIPRLRAMVMKLCATQEAIEDRREKAGWSLEARTMEYALPSYHVGNVSFVGRCDRVDSLANRGEILVDYKLGKSSNYKGSLQLASYAAIMKNEGATIAGFYYLGHADAALTGAFDEDIRSVYIGKPRTPFIPDEEMEKAVAQMESMADGVTSGRFAAQYQANACPRCPYKILCRRGEFCGESLAQEESSDGGEGSTDE